MLSLVTVLASGCMRRQHVELSTHRDLACVDACLAQHESVDGRFACARACPDAVVQSGMCPAAQPAEDTGRRSVCVARSERDWTRNGILIGLGVVVVYIIVASAVAAQGR